MNKVFLNCALICAIFLVKCNGQRAPSISYISQEQIKDVGETVELDCSVQNAREYTVLWIKTGKIQEDYVFLSTGSSLITKDSRFALRFDGASSTYTLQIKDIQESDAGIYQCAIILSVSNKITTQVDLSVRRPPIISDNSTQSIVASEGQSVFAECYASGYPAPTIIWRRENNAWLPTGGSTYNGNILNITSVRKDDHGNYYCVADNGVGSGDRRNISLEVEFSPVITAPRSRYGQALQYDMDIECHIEAYPPPTITWVKDNITLSNDQHYSISHFTTSDVITDSTLRVITIEEHQYGDYKCKAVNKLGQDKTNIHLVETVIPVCPPACDSTEKI